jgi:transcriptional regulator NrdR family protein
MRFPNPERCPLCGSESKIIDTRPHLDALETAVIAKRRERACRACHKTWMTYETTLNPGVIKQRRATS